MPFPGTIKGAREVVQRLVDRYGERALQAERNEGVDWKALSHAVRVGREALELLATGRITLPLGDAAEILAIKRGEHPYHAVAAEIERLLSAVETATQTSTLRARPDDAFIDGLVVRTYRAAILTMVGGDGFEPPALSV